MAQFYPSAVEFIKHRPFDVWVPAYYHPHIDKEIINPTLQPKEKINKFRFVAINKRNPIPMRQLDDPSQMERAKYSIEILLDMFQKQVEFELINDEDLPEILDGLDRYLLSIREEVSLGLDFAISYARLVVKWRERVYHHYYRYMMGNPTEMAKLYPQGNSQNNIWTLMSLMGGSGGQQPMNPLVAKRNPPYDVGKAQPVENDVKKIDDSFESSLGLSSTTMKPDDDFKFDYNDFISKGR